MDYKDTLILPQTSFDMRGNLPQNEPKRFKKWYDANVYEKMKIKRKNAQKSFNLHDGPPYANGHLHIGHALNKILKDMIVKTHYFFGEDIRYVPGWDCHGLPIEQQVESKLGDKKNSLSKSVIREYCREHAREFIDIQRDEFKALGVVGDWDDPYITMKFKFESDIYKTLCEIAKKGLLVERSKPVFWSWAAKSALAEAEVEYKDKEDYSIYVAFDLSNEGCKKLGVQKAKAVIWTTTPWTLPANEAISLSPSEKYVVTSENYIFAKPLLEVLINKNITEGKIIKEFDSQELEGEFAINPLNDRKSKIILGDHVMMDGGTGLVHTAPGHGEDDYFVALKYGIDITMPVDEEGKFDKTLKVKKLFRDDVVDKMVGVHIFKANEIILEILGESLIHSSKFTHSYPYCWRTHKPVIYRATKQWFIAMDEPKLDGKTLREVALSQIENVTFYPKSGIKRLQSMVENRPDWCISRQRDWGVPIAFFRDKSTKEPIFDEDILNNIAKIFEEKGADAWWDLEISELLPKNSKYNSQNLEKVMDILDVWFDSGSTWNAVLNSGEYDAGAYQTDMYLEGSDQHRGWFQSSLLISCAVNVKAPYKSILTHGFTVDEKGQKMSKSVGNVIAPSDVAKEYGVEILRLWVGLSDYSSDLKISKNILKQVSEQYRKIRNTIRFLLANVSDLKEIDIRNFNSLDMWILSRATTVFNETATAFKNYDFSKGFSLIMNFISVDLSGIYLDICKDRLYCDEINSIRRRSAQSAMAIIAKELLALIAPTLTYTVDEAIENAPKVIKDDNESVFDIVYKGINYKSDENYELLLKAREKFSEVIDTLKKDKIIKSTLELALQTSSDEILKADKLAMSDWFLVSDIEEISSDEYLVEFNVLDEVFRLVKSKKYKCPRCWKFSAENENEVCPRCKEVLDAK